MSCPKDIPRFEKPLPCGGTPFWDNASDCGYRCMDCFAVIGSIGMPAYCRELLDKENERKIIVKKMGFENETI